MDKLKRKLAVLGIFIVLGSAHLKDYEYVPNYEILEEDEAFASYDDGLIYIGDEEFIDSIIPNDGDILVIDEREGQDPNLKVRSSFEIQDKDKRNTIIEVLQEYEKRYPSNWNRTTETMRLEWLMHNLSYFYKYEVDRTKDVDLNNADEEVYKSKILRKIFRV